MWIMGNFNFLKGQDIQYILNNSILVEITLNIWKILMDWEPSKFREQRNGMEENTYYFKQIHNKNKEIEMRRKYFIWIKNNIGKSMITWLKTNKQKKKTEKSIYISRSEEKFLYQSHLFSTQEVSISLLGLQFHFSAHSLSRVAKKILSNHVDYLSPGLISEKSNKLWSYKNIPLAYKNVFIFIKLSSHDTWVPIVRYRNENKQFS